MYKISFSGHQASKYGQEIVYITESAVFKLIDSELVLEEIAPGIDLDRDIISKMEFIPKIKGTIKEMDSILFDKSKMNIKRDLLDN